MWIKVEGISKYRWDKVLLKLNPQIWKNISAKQIHHVLISRYDVPFPVFNSVVKVAYRLEFPNRLKIHPNLHVSFLNKFHENEVNELRGNKRAPPVIIFQTERKLS
ncbi:hypothetical protein F511_33041 [Dorcoceras hygrometricum]|uniref:Tf2-1-like SH3-like domain-containing protein n=1 Tax=Dorcoceras hygrometricum TaxID=472368 RepID=A0A2Z7D3Y9_9LAMI|nr:hypothetical protein F511_33041 [Dorcoceras hygrometricum]